MDAKTVGAVAALTDVSVRTLHHYDDIGLVVPSVRTPAGYRGYTDADIDRYYDAAEPGLAEFVHAIVVASYA
jgi:MerR family transcriptional regulator, thiopeptide resistance regulator